jgi:hypothetical protein
MFDILLKILISINLLSWIGYSNLNNSDIKIFYVSAIILFTYSLFIKPKREIKSKKIISALMLLCIYSIITHSFMAATIEGTINIFLSIVSFIVIYWHIDKPSNFYKWFIGLFLINIVIGFIDRYRIINHIAPAGLVLGTSAKQGISGTMGNYARLSTFFALMMPIIFNYYKNFFYKRTRAIIFILSLIAIFFSIFLSSSLYQVQTGIYLMFGLVCFLQIKNFRVKTIVPFVVMILILINLIYIPSSIISAKIKRSLGCRIEKTEQVIEYFNESNKWLVGYGIGRERYENDLERDCNTNTSLLSFIYATGIPGIIFLIFCLCLLFKNYNNNIACIFIICLLFYCCIEYPMQIIRLRLFIISMFAFFEISLGKENKNV